MRRMAPRIVGRGSGLAQSAPATASDHDSPCPARPPGRRRSGRRAARTPSATGVHRTTDEVQPVDRTDVARPPQRRPRSSATGRGTRRRAARYRTSKSAGTSVRVNSIRWRRSMPRSARRLSTAAVIILRSTPTRRRCLHEQVPVLASRTRCHRRVGHRRHDRRHRRVERELAALDPVELARGPRGRTTPIGGRGPSVRPRTPAHTRKPLVDRPDPVERTRTLADRAAVRSCRCPVSTPATTTSASTWPPSASSTPVTRPPRTHDPPDVGAAAQSTPAPTTARTRASRKRAEATAHVPGAVGAFEVGQRSERRRQPERRPADRDRRAADELAQARIVEVIGCHFASVRLASSARRSAARRIRRTPAPRRGRWAGEIRLADSARHDPFGVGGEPLPWRRHPG